MTMELAALMTALGHATNVFKTAVQARDDAKRLEATADINSTLAEISARYAAVAQQQLALLEKNEALSKQLAAYDKWEQEKIRYVLRQLPSGGFIYALNPAQKTHKPPHWLCTNCYESRYKSVLQLEIPATGESCWTCPKCENKVLSRGAWPTE